MLRADSFFGCCSTIPDEILAASRSWPSPGKDCSCSAIARYFLAESSGSSTRNPAGRRAGFVSTVARRAAHPHHPKRSKAAANFVTNCHAPLSVELMSRPLLWSSVVIRTGSDLLECVDALLQESLRALIGPIQIET